MKELALIAMLTLPLQEKEVVFETSQYLVNIERESFNTRYLTINKRSGGVLSYQGNGDDSFTLLADFPRPETCRIGKRDTKLVLVENKKLVATYYCNSDAIQYQFRTKAAREFLKDKLLQKSYISVNGVVFSARGFSQYLQD